MRREAWIAAGLWGLFWPSFAAAEEPSTVGTFHAPPECMDAERLRRLLEANSSQAPAASRRIVGQVELREGGYRFELVLEENGVRLGQRVLEVRGTDCHHEDEELGLIAAMLLEGPPDAEPTPSEPAPVVPPAPKPVEETPEEPAPANESSHLRFGMNASMGLSLEFQPGLAPGVVVGGVLELPVPLNVRASAAYFFPTIQDTGSVGVEMDRFSAGAELCGRLRPGPLQLEACAGGQAFLLWALGRGFPENHREDSFFLALTAMGRVLWPLGDAWRISGAGGVLVPSGQAIFVGTDESGNEVELFRSSRVGPQFELGAEFLFN